MESFLKYSVAESSFQFVVSGIKTGFDDRSNKQPQEDRSDYQDELQQLAYVHNLKDETSGLSGKKFSYVRLNLSIVYVL